MKIQSLILIVMISLNAHAQSLNWAFDIGSVASGDLGSDIIHDANGNIYVIGRFRGTCDFNPDAMTTNNLISNGVYDVFVAKYDNSGNYIWAFNIGGTDDDRGYSIDLDNNNNIYITGSFKSLSTEFDPNGTGNVLGSNGNSDLFLAKYDENGNHQWAFGIGGSEEEYGKSLVADDAGNTYITGRLMSTNVDFDNGVGSNILSNGTSGFDDHAMFLMKYDANGNHQWAFSLNDPDDFLFAEDVALNVAQTSVYFTGMFGHGAVDFDPSGTTNSIVSNNDDVFLAKYDANGNYEWAHGFGGDSQEFGGSVEVDAADNVYITGSFTSYNAKFDPNDNTNHLPHNGSYEVYLAKYNSGGTYQWAKNIAYNTSTDFYYCFGFDIAFDASSNVYVTGYFQGTRDFDPSANSHNITSNGGDDIFITKYTSAGVFEKAFGIGEAGSDAGFAITIDGSNNIHTTGKFGGTSVDFDPSGSTTNLATSADTDEDIFMASYPPVALVLPVELTYFTGEATENGNLLTWQTASEENNDGFYIERSEDGKTWETVDFVQGNGTTLEVSDYEYLDRNLLGFYYRLQQIDFNGEFEYSNIVFIENQTSDSEAVELRLFPNPVRDILNIENGEGQATIYNLLGQPMKTFLIHNYSDKPHELSSKFVIPLSDLSNGSYFIHIRKRDGTVVNKSFIKTN